MYFSSNATLGQIHKWFDAQLTAIYNMAKNGIDIEVRPHRRQRSTEQNRFLMAIMVAIVRFYQETGYMPAGCQPWMMRTDILKEYWKARLGVVSTAKLDTAAFGQFVDGIQRELVIETNGNWECLQPDSAYIQSLVNDGGF